MTRRNEPPPPMAWPDQHAVVSAITPNTKPTAAEIARGLQWTVTRAEKALAIAVTRRWVKVSADGRYQRTKGGADVIARPPIPMREIDGYIDRCLRWGPVPMDHITHREELPYHGVHVRERLERWAALGAVSIEATGPNQRIVRRR